jgi:hypothetical protein
LRVLLVLLCSVLLSACAAKSQRYDYCSVAEVADPAWVDIDRTQGYLVSKIGVVHSREAERDITRLVRQSLASNLYSDVHAYMQSTFDGENLATNHQINVATNVQLTNVRTSFEKVGVCLVAWATVSQKDAEIAVGKSHPINKAEHSEWQRIKDSQRISDYRYHLRKYPRGLYTETAKARIDVIESHKRKKSINKANYSPTARMLLNLMNTFFYE